MAQNLYVVVDEEAGHIVRSGFFGRELFTNKGDAREVASGDPDRTVFKLTTHGV